MDTTLAGALADTVRQETVEDTVLQESLSFVSARSPAQPEPGTPKGTQPEPGNTQEHFGLVMAKGSPVASCVDAAVTALQQDGTLAKLQQQWLSKAAGAPVLS